MRKFPLPVYLLPLLAACGGGDATDTGSIQSLQGPQQVSVIDASGGSNNTVRLPRHLRSVAGSDYQTDATRFWIRDNSLSALDTVNMILRSLTETQYWEQTNNGPYRALVQQDERNGGGERGNTGPVYEEWIVDSTRASNSAPQIASFWIKGVEQGEESVIYGKLTVTEEPSDALPLGMFTLYFKSLPVGEAATSTNTMFEGYMRTIARNDAQTEVEFYMAHGDVEGTVASGDYAQRERMHLLGNPLEQSGRAYTERRYIQNNGGSTYSEEGEYQLQFNADYVARRDVANGNTLSVLDRNDFETRVYRYGVYDGTTEARVDQLSGFPVQDSNGANGWAGFHGIWFPENVTLSNGQTLYRRSFQDNSTTPYTLVIAPGKLEKNTRDSITLGDIEGEDMEFFDPNGGGQTKVRFTGTDLVRVATMSNGEWQIENTPVSISSGFTTGQWCSFWSQARGNVEFSWPASLSTSTPAYVWSHTTLNADSAELASGDLTLHGYFHMLRAGITSDQANFQNSESPYLPDASSTSSGNQTYVFDKETLMLQLGGTDVNLANGVTITQGPGMFGLDCGPLFATALSSFGDISSQTVTYRWSFGSNSWNQLRTLKDANEDFVTFDPPTRFTYVHAENGSSYDGRTFFLEWDGSNLQGLPYEQDSGSGNWYPLLNIPTGTEVTAASTTYKIKQLEGEQMMVEVGSPNTVYTAQGFDIDGTTITEPEATPYQDPAIGEMPEVTAAPLYVGGIAQNAGG